MSSLSPFLQLWANSYFWGFSGHNQAVIRQLSGSCQAIGSCQSDIRQLSNFDLGAVHKLCHLKEGGGVKNCQFYLVTSQKGFSASKCDAGELDIFKIRNFSRNCLEIFWIFSGFFWGMFFGFFWRNFLGGFFGRIFLGGFSWEEFLVS